MKRLLTWLKNLFAKKKDIEAEESPVRENEDTDKPDDGGEYPDYPKDKEDLWYPLAIKSEGKMRTRGTYKNGYPQGAVVHYTAGRSRIKSEGGGKRNKDIHREVGIQSVNSAVEKGSYAYFLIDRSGTVYQNFPLNRWGYHAGKSSWEGLYGSVSDELVGIEIQNAGRLKPKDNDYVAWFTSLSRGDGVFKEDEVRHVKSNANQQRGTYQKYSEAQEESLKELLIWMKRNNPDAFTLSLVVGHDEVAPSRKSDPGGSLSMTMPAFRRELEEEYIKRYS